MSAVSTAIIIGNISIFFFKESDALGKYLVITAWSVTQGRVSSIEFVLHFK